MIRLAHVWAILVLLCVLVPVHAQAQGPPDETLYQIQVYDGLVNTYRSGDLPATLAKLDAMLASRTASQQLKFWLKSAGEKRRIGSVECVMLIYTEAVYAAWRKNLPLALNGSRRYLPYLTMVRAELRRLDGRSAFLRRWYPFWEAMLHGIIDDFDTWDPGLDLLPEALEAYPDDSEILLGAGARYELLWWRLEENSHRSLVGGQFSSRDRLVRASGYLRRSIAANPAESEARLRLARVLAELGEYREGLAVIAGDDWKSESVFEYLARMVEGDLYERLGDTGAAAAAYDKAIPLVRVPQSARIAKAFLEHQSGARQEAVEEVLRATSLPLDENDPWWVYLRGQLWRRDTYLKRLRSMVQP